MLALTFLRPYLAERSPALASLARLLAQVHPDVGKTVRAIADLAARAVEIKADRAAQAWRSSQVCEG